MLFADAVILLLQGVDLIQHLGVGLFQCLLVKRHIVAVGQLSVQCLHLSVKAVQLLDVRQKRFLLRFRQSVGATDKCRLVKVCEVVVVGQGVADFVQLFPQRCVSLEDGVALFLNCLDLLPDGVLFLGGNFSNRLHWCGCGGKGGGCCADGCYHQRQCQYKAPNRFLFHGILLSFFNRFGWASTLIVVYRRAPNTFPAKVHGKCHKSATRPARKMNESPLHASRAETGGRSYSDFTSRIKMDLIHIFPGPFAKASHFAP